MNLLDNKKFLLKGLQRVGMNQKKLNELDAALKYLDFNNNSFESLFWDSSQQKILQDAAKRFEQGSKSEKLTIVILVKNQEKLIQKVINLVLPYCDELIVVDTGSEDRTIENVLSIDNKKIRIEHLEWVEDFGYMRNKAAEFANNKWIFFLDSDEFFDSGIEPREFKNLLLITDILFPNIPLCLTIESHFWNSSRFYISGRIFRKNDPVRYVGKVHEDIFPKTGFEEKFITLNSDLKVNNYGTQESEIEKFDKSYRYMSILREMLVENSNSIRTIAQINPEYLKSPEEINEYKVLLESAVYLNSEEPPSLFNLKETGYLHSLLTKLVTFYQLYNEEDVAVQLAEIGLKKFPGSIPLIFYKYSSMLNREQEKIRDILNMLLLDYASIDTKSSEKLSLMNDDLLKALVTKFFFQVGEFEMAKNLSDGICDSVALEYINLEKAFLNNGK